MIFDKAGRILIGLKSLGDKGLKTFKIGVIIALFHLSGKIDCSNEIFIICAYIPDILSINNFNTKMFIPSTPACGARPIFQVNFSATLLPFIFGEK